MSGILFKKMYSISMANTEFRTALRKIYKHYAATDVMGILGQAYMHQILQQAEFLNMKLPYLDDPKKPVALKNYTVSALSISQILAIPRTTIIRCLDTLIKQDYVVKTPKGYYISLDEFRRDTLPIYQKYYKKLNNIKHI